MPILPLLDPQEPWILVAEFENPTEIRFTPEFLQAIEGYEDNLVFLIGHLLGLCPDPFSQKLQLLSNSLLFPKKTEMSSPSPLEILQFWDTVCFSSESPFYDRSFSSEEKQCWINFCYVKLLSIQLPKSLIHQFGQIRAALPKDDVESILQHQETLSSDSFFDLLHHLEQETDTENTAIIFEKIVQDIEQIGPECLPVLADLLREHFVREESYQAILKGVIGLAKHSDFMRDECIETCALALKRFSQNSPELNAHLILTLLQLRAKNIRNLVAQAFQEGAVYLPLTGSFEKMESQLFER